MAVDLAIVKEITALTTGPEMVVEALYQTHEVLIAGKSPVGPI